ncbi:hypothetical protein VNO77_18106 [Canavalia gladiata]|uniref:Uncharacterized protein n=1 Tax=Canavalia gladiata TaxID=3824 RepID=A0AAN9LK80_CANGL
MVAMAFQKKAKDFFNSLASIPKEVFYNLTLTLLTLLLPLSFLLLARFSDAQYYLQTLTWYHSSNPFPYVLTLALHLNPFILYLLVSIVSIASLIYGLTGKTKITLLNDPPSSSSVLQPRLYTAWILLCSFQVCVGLGIEGSIVAGLYDSDSSFGIERSLLSRVIFLLGLHQTTQVWSRMVVRPVVNDTVFGIARKEKWVERVALAASLGTLWWWRLREDVEILVVMVEAKKEQLMDVRITDFVGWWLYYVTVTIGMVRVVKGLMWMAMICLCRRRVSGISTVEPSHNDDKNEYCSMTRNSQGNERMEILMLWNSEARRKSGSSQVNADFYSQELLMLRRHSGPLADAISNEISPAKNHSTPFLAT